MQILRIVNPLQFRFCGLQRENEIFGGCCIINCIYSNENVLLQQKRFHKLFFKKEFLNYNEKVFIR